MQRSRVVPLLFRGTRKGMSSGKPAAMKDEYGKMDSSGIIYKSQNFVLESGVVLPEVQACYNTFGQLNERRDNLLVVCHALTGNSRLDQWWGTLLGPGKALDTDKYMVMCANVMGSCYGTTGPSSLDPSTGRTYGMSFPAVTIRDTVRLHMELARNALGATSVVCAVGGSMGGMQALEWGLLGEDYVRRCVIIGCGAAHTAWQIGISETQRQAIYMDPCWRGGDIDPDNPPVAGLAVARQIAMLSYRTARSYEAKFGRGTDAAGNWQVRSYLAYQGIKFRDRFDAVTYVKITEQMDAHDVGRGRGGTAAALARMRARCLVMGIDSDVLYPLQEQVDLAAQIPGSVFKTIASINGHDGFLLEHETVNADILEFLQES
jgi:homoserine O-acetyltransferase